MKVILTGATGFIGSGVLHHCLSNPSITSLIALSRRPLPEAVTRNPNLKVIILEDFLSYTDTTLQELSGAEACIWSMGIALPPDIETGRKVNLDYPMVAADIFATSLAPQLEKGKRFRFVYVSGTLAVRDQEEKLWFGQEGRRLRGEVENRLIELAKQKKDVLETYIARPGFVLSKGNFMAKIFMGVSRCNRVDELAAVMTDMALNGSKEQIMEYYDLNQAAA
ncbi:hypothetical protein MMC06_001545 [Schaereria dolodes]|nr:hypothetical protein [Schaereria dolodes]